MANDFISEEELKRYMKDKPSFHAALAANGYFMPALKNSFVTCDLMFDIYYERCYFPKCEWIKLRNCLHPPNSKQLVEIICELFEHGFNYTTEKEAKQCKRLCKHLRRNKPE